MLRLFTNEVSDRFTRESLARIEKFVNAHPLLKTNWSESLRPKQYYLGQSYNGVTLGLTLSVHTPTALFGHFIPYQTEDGLWRLQFSFGVKMDVADSVIYAQITDVAPANSYAALPMQAIASAAYSGALGVRVSAGYTYFISETTGNFTGVIPVALAVTADYWFLSGDIALVRKPTWAD